MRCVGILLGSLAVQLALAGVSEAADPRATQLTYEPWTKTCLTQASCFVATGARGQCAPSGGHISISPQNSKRALLTANVGTRTMLEGMISLQIDQDAPMKIPATHCYASGCGGTLEIDPDLIERLKHAQTIKMDATSLTGQKVTLSFSLASFAKTFDGPGTEPKVYEEIVSRDKMEALQKQSDEQRKASECSE